MPGTLHGAKEIAYSRFGGGLVTDVDPTEILDDQASNCLNVDFRDQSVSARKGQLKFNASAPASAPVKALHRFYPPVGTPLMLMQSDGDIWEDNGAGVFSAAASGLAGGVPGDFIQWNDVVYFGNPKDPMLKRTYTSGGAVTWAVVSLPPTPALPGGPTEPNFSLAQFVYENFDSHTTHASDPTQGWVEGADIAVASGITDIQPIEGADCLKVTMSAGAPGQTAVKAWSDADPNTSDLNGAVNNSTTTFVVDNSALFGVGDYLQVEAEVVLVTANNTGTNTLTVTRARGGTTAASHADETVITRSALDISEADSLVVYYYSANVGINFKIGVRDNTGQINWSLFPVWTTAEKEVWTPIQVPLAGIPPSSRTASLGLGFQFVSRPASISFPFSMYLDQGMPQGPLAADDYDYYATWAYVSNSNRFDTVTAESNPTPVAHLSVPSLPPVYGVLAQPPFGSVPTAPPGQVTVANIYRYRHNGTIAQPVLVGSIPSVATTLAAAVDTAATSITLTAPTGYQGSVAGVFLQLGGNETVLVTGVDPTTGNLTVIRGWEGTPAAHAAGASVSAGGLFDWRGDGALVLADPPVLISGQITPPLASAYCRCNGRLVAGNVRLPSVQTDLNGSITSGATTLVVDSATGFSVNDYIQIDTEVLQVTAISGTTFTVARGQLGSTAASHSDEAVVTGALYRNRIYLSRFNFPEQFGVQLQPTLQATLAGWINIPNEDAVLRLVEFDGMLIIFCERSIWSLEGTGWDDFVLRKRADVGLVAREAVALSEREIYFLAEDGVRILSPSREFVGLFSGWLVDEPVNSIIRSIPPAYRGNTAMGMDERGRIVVSYTPAGQTVNQEALVFDPRQPGALEYSSFTGSVIPEHQANLLRKGWTHYANWGFSVFKALKRGGGQTTDAGQLLGGDPTNNAFVRYLHRDGNDNDLFTDDGTAITWNWTGKAIDAGASQAFEWTYVGLEADANSQTATTINQNGGIAPGDASVTVTSATGFAINDYAQIDTEVVQITNIVGAVFTITRAQAGTGAASHANAAAVTLVNEVLATPVPDGVASGTTYLLNLGTAATGYVKALRRTAASIKGRFSALTLSGVQRFALRIRGARVGVYTKISR